MLQHKLTLLGILAVVAVLVISALEELRLLTVLLLPVAAEERAGDLHQLHQEAQPIVITVPPVEIPLVLVVVEVLKPQVVMAELLGLAHLLEDKPDHWVKAVMAVFGKLLPVVEVVEVFMAVAAAVTMDVAPEQMAAVVAVLGPR